MSLCHHVSILLAGSALTACSVAAQEVQQPPSDGREFRICRITLPDILGKPVSIKLTVEQVESTDAQKALVTRHWEEEWVRDSEGRVWRRQRAPKEAYQGTVPPVTDIWLENAAAGSSTACSVAERKCWVSEYHQPSPVLLFPDTATQGSSVCWVAEGDCQIHEYHESVRCGEKRFVRTFLGEYSIGGISMGRTQMWCYKPDGSGVGADLWHNSEFDIDFGVRNFRHLRSQQRGAYYSIDQISPSVPDNPELLQVPPRGYSLQLGETEDRFETDRSLRVTR